jgi:hypothetical protein
MNLRTPLLAIGAVLLLVAAVVLPVSAAGPSMGNQTDCPNEDCDQNMYQHQNGVAKNTANTIQDSNATNASVNPQGDADRNMYQYQNHIASGLAASSSSLAQGHYAYGENQKRQGDGMAPSNGDQDRIRTQSQLRDGSCGNCPNL